jgi:hypothetical protein
MDTKQELIQRLLVRTDSLHCKRNGETFENANARRGRCHDNVKEWIRTNEYPDEKRVWGWLRNDDEIAMQGIVIFYAHSIVKCQDGTYLDVTLRSDEDRYPFYACQLSEAEFDCLADANNQKLTHIVDQNVHHLYSDPAFISIGDFSDTLDLP